VGFSYVLRGIIKALETNAVLVIVSVFGHPFFAKGTIIFIIPMVFV
jgi:hypothetical protein